MKTYGGVEFYLHTFLNSVPDGGVSFIPQLLDSNGKSFQNPLNRRLGGPKIQLGVVLTRKFLSTCQRFTLVIHPVASHYTIFKHLVIQNDISDIISNLTITTTVLLINDIYSQHTDSILF
jgi:hypothetical protein